MDKQIIPDHPRLFTLVLPTSLYEELRSLAYQERVSIAHLIREAVKKEIQRHRKEDSDLGSR
ncbi:MAG: hypothetical protein DRP09_18685 [Candidatus Thorarchaeota archaeon]|nr:MAG: hypothetical protein DRP09_18685 [Candidatus Thorarchaeota archaeon]